MIRQLFKNMVLSMKFSDLSKIIPIMITMLSAVGGFAYAEEAEEAEEAKVVCFGDSITKRGYPEIMAKELGVGVINSGVAGHTSSQGLHRIKKDVLDHDPKVVVVFFGTNDIRVDSKKFVPLKKYRKNLEEIVKSCKKRGIKVVFCTPPPINPKTYFERHKKSDFEAHGGLAKLLKSYQDTARKVGKELGIPVVDLASELAKQPKWMHKDGVHPSPAGNQLIADHVMKVIRPLLKKRDSSGNLVRDFETEE